MTITATFSNGFIDTYKGKRPVTAAWMITEKATGKVLMSGHSIDAKTAEKTAHSNVRAHFAWGENVPRPNCYVHSHQYWGKKAREHGHKDWAAWYAADQNARAGQAKLYSVEIVAL